MTPEHAGGDGFDDRKRPRQSAPVVADRLEQSLEGLELAGSNEVAPRSSDERPGQLTIARGESMLDRSLDRPVFGVPRCRSPVQLKDDAGILGGQLRSEQLSE